ncbi:5-formyltetrahydrofolate cyclo-ligase [Hymenopellis radicata]|nr:5-formyltetrahydrofolate cyclo-ligase [Hymenopellis radicata]
MSAGSLVLKAQKKVLRKSVTTTLKILSASSIEEQSNAVRDRILALPSFRQCRTVSCYLSMPSGELDTSSLVREILNLGKHLYVPKIDASSSGESKMNLLRIHDHADLDAIPKGLWGIPDPSDTWDGAPRQNALEEDLDLILVPGVAFDRSRSRLGHGKGYYDRFIASYTASGRPKPLLVALSLREQLLGVNEVPVGETDWEMDAIVTPDRIVDS